MDCEICNGDNLRDFPLCKGCETLRHFTNRADCQCESCQNPNLFPAAVKARFPGLVLIAKSDDPAELRRVGSVLEALKPEHRIGAARAIANLIESAVKAAA